MGYQVNDATTYSCSRPSYLTFSTGWPVIHGRVFLVPCKKWLVHWPVYGCKGAYTGQVPYYKVPENTAMFIWSGCTVYIADHAVIISNVNVDRGKIMKTWLFMKLYKDLEFHNRCLLIKLLISGVPRDSPEGETPLEEFLLPQTQLLRNLSLNISSFGL